MGVGELNYPRTCEHEQTIVDDGDEKRIRFDQKIVVVTAGAFGWRSGAFLSDEII